MKKLSLLSNVVLVVFLNKTTCFVVRQQRQLKDNRDNLETTRINNDKLEGEAQSVGAGPDRGNVVVANRHTAVPRVVDPAAAA